VAIEEGAYFKGKVDIQKDTTKTDGVKPVSAASASAAASSAAASSSKATVAMKINPSDGK